METLSGNIADSEDITQPDDDDDDDDTVELIDNGFVKRIKDFINDKLHHKVERKKLFHNVSNSRSRCNTNTNNAQKPNTTPDRKFQKVFRTYSTIMKSVNRHSYCYNDLVSTMKQRGRRRNRKSVKPRSLVQSSGSSDSEDEHMERTELLESLIYGDHKQEMTSSEYYYAIKLLRLIEACNPATSVLCLYAFSRMKVKSSVVQQAICDMNGIQTFLNFIHAHDLRCRLSALKVLREISEINKNAKQITLLGGVPNLVGLLREDNYDLKLMGAEIISRVCHFSHARSKVRLNGGIDYLVCQLDIIVGNDKSKRMDNKRLLYDLKVGKASACALWACSRSSRNRACMREAGIIPILGRLLKANNSDFLVPVIGTLQECAADRHYQIGIRSEGMVTGLIQHLRCDNKWLSVQCATTFYKCATDEAIQTLVRKHNGLEALYQLLNLAEEEQVLAFAATGAIWKVAISMENATELERLGTTKLLIRFLKSQPPDLDEFMKIGTAASERLSKLEQLESISTNIFGAVSELAKVEESRTALRKCGGLEILVKMLSSTCIPLLYNVNNALNRCASDIENVLIIERLEGIRYLISLLKHKDIYVKSSAAWALVPYLASLPHAATIIRAYVGYLDVVVGLLESRDEEIISSGCALIAEIAKDGENLAVMSEYGITRLLSDLVRSTNDRLRSFVADAIASCCGSDTNIHAFGESGVVRHISQFYLASSDSQVQMNATRALHKLSALPKNCVEMNRVGVLRRLIGFLGSNNETLQLAAVGTIGNIRRLGLANEKSRTVSKSRNIAFSSVAKNVRTVRRFPL